MAKELEPDSLFQVLLKSFYLAFGIENLSQINTELKEILASSVRIDAIVTYDDDFDFTKLVKRIFPWLGKNNVFEYKGKSDPLKVGQYCQYSLVELGLMVTRCLSKERKDKRGREWLSQRNVRSCWNKLKNQGAKYFCTTTILSTGDPKNIREGGEFEAVGQYPHLRGALYRKIIFEDKFIGAIPVYLVVLNKLKICAINTPLLLLSTGEKQKEFCRWLLTDAEGLTIEEQVTYQSYIVAYGVVEDEEVKEQMARKVWKPDYNKVAEWLYEGMPPEIRGEVLQKLLSFDPPEVNVQKILGVDSLEEMVLKLAKTKEQQKQLLEFLRRNLEENEE